MVTDMPTALQPGGRFDYYACTLNSTVERLRDVFSVELVRDWEPREGARHGFQHREEYVLSDGTTALTLLHGGNGGLPHAYASSDHTDDFVRIIRANWDGMHRVSRMDAALDYDSGARTWDRLLAVVQSIALGEKVDGDTRSRVTKVRTNQMGDWLHGEHGRTFYLGSFKSAVLVRLYEKGIQLREDAKLRGRDRTDLSDNLCRLEVQVRPDGAAKERAAKATPLDAFGYAGWSRELLRRVEASDVERVLIRERRESDHERALNWMVQQYEAHLLMEVSEVGGWDRLGQALRARLELGRRRDEDTWEQEPF